MQSTYYSFIYLFIYVFVCLLIDCLIDFLFIYYFMYLLITQSISGADVIVRRDPNVHCDFPLGKYRTVN